MFTTCSALQFLIAGNMSAVTIGGVTIVRPEDADDPILHRHEQRHQDRELAYGLVGWLWRYIVEPHFRLTEEADAYGWAISEVPEAQWGDYRRWALNELATGYNLGLDAETIRSAFDNCLIEQGNANCPGIGYAVS